MPLQVTAGVLLAADADTVWRLALDWSRQREWIPLTTARGGTGPGAQVTARTGIGKASFTDNMVITEWDPPRRCVVRHTGRVVRGAGIFEVLPRTIGAQSACEFRWTERFDLPVPQALRPAANRVAAWTVVPVVRLALAVSLRRLARLLG